mgnify:CR=1 FL=1|tara:strand:- start:345 stop:1529 length:1185 start_codon:yes stop_codon:yes gene_type:complete
MKYRLKAGTFVVSGLLIALGGMVPAVAQTQDPAQNPPQNQETPDKPQPASVVSPDLIDQALAGDNDAVAALAAFLRGTGAKNPEQITQRTTALIAQIGRQKGGVGTDSLLSVIDRIASNAISLVAGAQIVRVGVDSDFVPSRAVLAWDFGPADGNVAPGFERVLPNDVRVGGAALDGLRRPAESELLNDGITGVERIEVDIPDGEYRIILMTQNLGDRQLMSNPFGSEISVNGNAQAITQPSPDDWGGEAVLSNRGLQNISGRVPPGGAGNGFITGNLDNFNASGFQRQQGGAVIVNAVARGGKLIIELKGFNNSRSYLTGLMVEPAEETSDLVLSREAADTLVPPQLRLALEENILAAAADVLSDIDPAQGDPELVELPEPILDPEELASTSS